MKELQAEELRIGNLLDCEFNPNDEEDSSDWGHYVEISAFDISSILSGNKCWRPIPLTPEILEKAGFEKSDGYWRFNEWSVIEIRDSKYYWTFDLYGGDAVDLEIQYLHQLQNLFKCLTGQELTIQL